MDTVINNNNNSSAATHSISCYPFPHIIIAVPAKQHYRAAFLASVLVAVLIVVVNITGMVGITLSKQYKRLSYKLLLMLSVTDALTGMTTLPLYSVYLHGLAKHGGMNCVVIKIMTVFSYSMLGMSLLIVGFITIQLYLAVAKPFLYENAYNQKICLPFLVLLCVLVLLVSILFTYDSMKTQWATLRIVTSVNFSVFYIFICLLHWRIYMEMSKMKVRAETQSNQRISLKKTVRITTLILAAFGLCFFPLCIEKFVVSYTSLSSSWMKNVIETWLELALFCNSFFNPLIYSLRLRSIRSKIMLWINCKHQKTVKIPGKIIMNSQDQWRIQKGRKICGGE